VQRSGSELWTPHQDQRCSSASSLEQATSTSSLLELDMLASLSDSDANLERRSAGDTGRRRSSGTASVHPRASTAIMVSLGSIPHNDFWGAAASGGHNCGALADCDLHMCMYSRQAVNSCFSSPYCEHPQGLCFAFLSIQGSHLNLS